MKIAKPLLSLAAEYAVASELCQRGIYAQLTFGNQKRTDILISQLETGKMLRIEVKAKQSRSFPNCLGVFAGAILVFVDFQDKELSQRPDFYILSEKDWIEVLKKRVKEFPNKEIKINEENCPIWINQITKTGKPYKGMGISVKHIKENKERWDKIEEKLK